MYLLVKRCKSALNLILDLREMYLEKRAIIKKTNKIDKALNRFPNIYLVFGQIMYSFIPLNNFK